MRCDDRPFSGQISSTRSCERDLLAERHRPRGVAEDAAELRQYAPKFKGDVNPNTVEARSLRRVDDSFSWSLSPRAHPPNCARWLRSFVDGDRRCTAASRVRVRGESCRMALLPPLAHPPTT